MSKVTNRNVTDADGLPYNNPVKADFAEWLFVAKAASEYANAQELYEALCKMPRR